MEILCTYLRYIVAEVAARRIVLQLLAAMAVAVVLGVILAALAAVYPSFKAARLAPMEAMRIQ